MTEELRDPYKNLPRAIYISLPLVTVIYVLANMAYCAVLNAQQMIASDAIAVVWSAQTNLSKNENLTNFPPHFISQTFGNEVLSYGQWIIPVLVAVSAFGGLSVHIMTSSRMCFVGARNGHMPTILSHINIDNYTPTPSLVFLCILSLIMVCIPDVYVLITYSSIVESFFIMVSVSGVLYFRWKRPNMERPIKVSAMKSIGFFVRIKIKKKIVSKQLPLIVPIVFILICAFLIIVPCYVAPYEVLMGVLITVIGIPVYLVGVVWRNKPEWLNSAIRKFVRSIFGCLLFF